LAMTLRKARAVAIIWLVMSTSVLSVRDREVKKSVQVTIESGGVKGQRKSYGNHTNAVAEDPCVKDPNLPRCQDLKDAKGNPVTAKGGAKVLDGIAVTAKVLMDLARQVITAARKRILPLRTNADNPSMTSLVGARSLRR